MPECTVSHREGECLPHQPGPEMDLLAPGTGAGIEMDRGCVRDGETSRPGEEKSSLQHDKAREKMPQENDKEARGTNRKASLCC